MENSSLPSVVSSVRTHLNGLTPAERKVAEYVLANKSLVMNMSMMEIADKIAVSDATVLRFIRTIGFDSYNTFKISLAAEMLHPSEAVFESISPDDSYGTIMHKVINEDIQLLKETLKMLDRDMIEKAIKLIKAARNLYIFAVASSEPMAIWLYDRIFRLGYHANVITDSYRMLVQSSLAEADDLYIMVSRSGTPSTVVESLRIIKEKSPDTKTLSLVCDITSPMALESDVCLCGVSNEVRSDIAGSTVALLSIINVLYTCLELVDINNTVEKQDSAWDALSILHKHKREKPRSE